MEVITAPSYESQSRSVASETYKPEDVALDPWQAFIIGAEENSYSDMSNATQFCNQLIEDYGVTLWIPIHLGKDRSKIH